VFVTEVGGKWFLATPDPFYYRVADSGEAEKAVIAFLGDGVRFDSVGKIIEGGDFIRLFR
jgi:hypothetical protein